MFERTTPARPADPVGLGWRARRHARWLEAVETQDLHRAWRAACEGAGACQRIDTVSGPTILVPRITGVRRGPVETLMVELLPGQLPADLAGVAHRIAPHLGVPRLRITPSGLGYVRVELLLDDPLGTVVEPVTPVGSALQPLTLGVAEDGQRVALDLVTASHVIVQGTTGGGKSVGLYSLLGQLTEARDVRITGCDPSALLLGPWASRWADVPAPALGTRDPARHVLVLDGLVRAMDARVAGLPAGRDQVELGARHPVVLVVLEEYPGLLRILDTADPKLGKQARALIGRLLAEGRKAGIRVVLVSQRADAGIIGGYERGQASHRISFRVDSADAVRMLHPDGTAELAAEHATAPPGVALLTAPGRPLTRFRAPYLPYGEYTAAVSGWPFSGPDSGADDTGCVA